MTALRTPARYSPRYVTPARAISPLPRIIIGVASITAVIVAFVVRIAVRWTEAGWSW